MTAHETIRFESPQYLVREHVVSPDQPVYVCFDGWMHARDAEAYHAFGYQFLRSRNLNTIEIVCRRNDWYQSDQAPAAIQAIRAAIGHRQCFGYGSSMGGYAAINFAEEIGFELVIAFSPQFTVDHTKFPTEHRWDVDVEQIAAFTADHALTPKAVQAVVFFDPHDRLDAAHVAAIEQRCPGLSCIPVPFGGHISAEFVAATGLLQEIALGLFQGRLDRSDVRMMIRRRRREVGLYWANLALAVAERRRLRQALVYARAAFKRRSDAYLITQHTYPEMLYLSGRHRRARKIWRRYLASGTARAAHEYMIRQAATRWGLADLIGELGLAP